MITGIIIATAVVAGVGIVIGLILGIADLKLHVDVDEKELAILDIWRWRHPSRRDSSGYGRHSQP